MYAYDELGRLAAVTDSMGVIRYAYDEYSRLASKSTYDLGIIKYAYTAGDKVSGITTNVNGMDMGTVSYEYDLMERIVKVVGHDGSATLYEYDALGNRTAVKHEGGLTVRYEYDECSRLIHETVTDKDSNVLMYYGYVYGNAGEKTQAVEVVRDSADDENARVIWTVYGYDKLLRLTEETIYITESVSFDSLKFRQMVSGSAESGKSVADILWSGNIRNQYSYDSVSNRISKETAVSGDVCGLDESVEIC